MEWVETTGKSVEEALDMALDQLGVDEADAEYEVVGEPKVGLFGRVRAEARIRARVRPTAPPSKEASNTSRRRRSGRNDRSSKDAAPTRRGNAGGGSSDDRSGDQDKTEADKAQRATNGEKGSGSTRKPARSRNRRKPVTTTQGAAVVAEEDIALSRQGEVASDFLSGLLVEIQSPVDISVAVQEEDEIVAVSVDGDNLGHLIGPRGATLHSLQELTRTVVQRQTGARNGRIIVDVGHYREKRREALEHFSRQVAVEVLAAGDERALEPMNPADRKVVHDVIGTIDGVSTRSEGEDPRRRVVIKSDSTQSNEAD